MAEDHSAEARRILLALDVSAMRKFHTFMQPKAAAMIGNDAAVLAGMHSARTLLDILPLRAREYSHRWLTERGMPSQLPPHLWPKAERFVPEIVEGVGIMVSASSPELEPAALLVRGAMEDVVLDAYADSHSPDPAVLQARMMEARKKELKSLILPDMAR